MDGHIGWTQDQWQAFKDLPRDTPLNMLNLVRVRDWAAYDDDRRVTGLDAYKTYGRDSQAAFAKVGGHVLWRGAFEIGLIAPPDERWDFCFIAYYPNAAAFIAMQFDPDYQAAVKHRQAAVFDSRLIRLGVMDLGDNFAS
ncbi:MAG: DUF1330 domain-containing protein [Pseudomonadota bacterium]